MTPEDTVAESPFVTIWEAPRETVRRIVATDPRRHVNWLFFAAGVVGGLQGVPNWVEKTGIALPILAAVLACVVLGLISIPLGHMNAAYKRWVGSLLGGEAPRAAVAAVSAWSTIPMVVGQGGIWLVQVVLYGRELMSPEHPTIDAAPRLVQTTFLLASVLFGLWTIVIAVAGFAEVNRFSIARSIATSILAVVIMGVVLAAMVLLVVATLWR